MSGGVRIIYNHFPRYAGLMRRSVADVVHDTAESILDDAQAHVPTASGELKASGRTAYEDDGTQAIVGYDDFKAIWNEYGTGAPAPTRAQPFLTPAAESNRSRFESALRSIRLR